MGQSEVAGVAGRPASLRAGVVREVGRGDPLVAGLSALGSDELQIEDLKKAAKEVPVRMQRRGSLTQRAPGEGAASSSGSKEGGASRGPCRDPAALDASPSAAVVPLLRS